MKQRLEGLLWYSHRLESSKGQRLCMFITMSSALSTIPGQQLASAFFKYIYLATPGLQSSQRPSIFVVACGIFSCSMPTLSCGNVGSSSLTRDQTLGRVLATGPPGKYPWSSTFLFNFYPRNTCIWLNSTEELIQ